MSSVRKDQFDASTAISDEEGRGNGIWELPDHVLDLVSGGNDFTQSTSGGGISFAQNFSCFAQNIGNFSQGTPPQLQYPTVDG